MKTVIYLSWLKSRSDDVMVAGGFIPRNEAPIKGCVALAMPESTSTNTLPSRIPSPGATRRTEYGCSISVGFTHGYHQSSHTRRNPAYATESAYAAEYLRDGTLQFFVLARASSFRSYAKSIHPIIISCHV